MTVTFKLERAGGTPAEPPSIRTEVYVWRAGDTIPLGATSPRMFACWTTKPTRLRPSLGVTGRPMLRQDGIAMNTTLTGFPGRRGKADAAGARMEEALA
jgi:hypothetical protein